MSVKRRRLASGKTVWDVRWRDAGRATRAYSKTFDRRRDADAFDQELRRQQRLGGVTHDAGRETLADFAHEWWRLYADVQLAPRTRLMYADLWDRYILERLGGLPLRRLTPNVVESFQAELRAAGVPDPTILKVLSLLQGVLERAVLWERIQSNPVAAISKPHQRRGRVRSPPLPSAVEAMRLHLLLCNRVGDATLVSLLAYAGLRPGEALGLEWHRPRSHPRRRAGRLPRRDQGDEDAPYALRAAAHAARARSRPLARDLAMHRTRQPRLSARRRHPLERV